VVAVSDVIEQADTSTALVPAVPPQPPITLFRTEDPYEVVTKVTETAHALGAVIRKQKLDVSIQGRRYVKVEGWTLLGSMLGVFPICSWTRKLENGWEARVEARTLAGAIVGAAEAECLRSERSWAQRDDYALRSMAQTRATSKAMRQPLGFVVALAGYESTPAEEMPPPETAEARAPVATPTAPAPAVAYDPEEALATEKTANLIWALIGKLDKAGVIARDKLVEAIGREYGSENPHELTRSQASDLIKRLKARAGETS
jgi:hypothetical protein